MSTSIEIEVESESCDCCEDCKMYPKESSESKDSMLAELKKLLSETGSNGLADRQMKIDELIGKINELGD